MRKASCSLLKLLNFSDNRLVDAEELTKIRFDDYMETVSLEEEDSQEHVPDISWTVKLQVNQIMDLGKTGMTQKLRAGKELAGTASTGLSKGEVSGPTDLIIWNRSSSADGDAFVLSPHHVLNLGLSSHSPVSHTYFSSDVLS